MIVDVQIEVLDHRNIAVTLRNIIERDVGHDARLAQPEPPNSVNRRMSLLLMLLLSLQPDIVREPQVQTLMRELVRDARAGFEHREGAAFIVRSATGNFYSIEWPSNGALDSARWTGAIPAGTVAIAHTHPTHLPMPSNIDAVTARGVHIPVYVVTPAKITRTDGGEGVVVAEW